MKATLKIILEDNIVEDGHTLPTNAEIMTSIETEQPVLEIHRTFTPIVTSSIVSLIDLVAGKLSQRKEVVRKEYKDAKAAQEKAKQEAEEKAKKEVEEKAKKEKK